MTDEAAVRLRQTPLAAVHERLGGRMVPFAGFAMPVQYSSIVDEHRRRAARRPVRRVAHGPDRAARRRGGRVPAARAGERPGALARPGAYAMLCNEAGGIIDDLIVYGARTATSWS